MKKINVLVNKNQFKIEFQSKSSSSTINDVIQQVNQIKGFPNKAKVEITVDNQKRDRKFLIKDIQNPIIYVDFSDEIENFMIQHFSKDKEHKIILEKADTCKQLSEIEKQIAQKLDCQQYIIRIMKKNQFFDKTLLLCQIFIFQQEIFYVVLVKFYIKYKNQYCLFQIDAFSHFDQIKQKVRQKFGIEEEIDLQFQNKILQDQQTYFSQKIPDSVELVLSIKCKQNIQIQYKKTNYNYSVSVNITIKDLLQQFQQIYSIHQNQKLLIKFNDKILQDDIRIHSLDLSKTIQFKMENQIVEKSMQIQFIDNEKPQNNFSYNVSNLDFFSSIYRLKNFEGKICEFFVDGQKLQITNNLIFDQIKFNNNNYQIQYSATKSQLINVRLYDDDINFTTIQVTPQDLINLEIKKKFSDNEIRITAYKQGQKLDLNETFGQQQIKDGDKIRCFFSDIVVQIQIRINNEDWPQIEQIRIDYLATVKDLKQQVIKKYKINDNIKVLCENKNLDEQDLLKDYPKNTIFIISKEIQFKFEFILQNNIHQAEQKFFETDKVKQIKSNLKEIYEDEVDIVDEDYRNLDEEEEISTYLKKLIRVSRQNIDVKYKIQNQQIIIDQKFNKNLTLKEMMQIIADKKSRCYIENNLLDEETKLNELILEPQTIIIIEHTSHVQLIEYNNNLNSQDIEFYPEEIINDHIQNHISEKSLLLFNNCQVNKLNSFRDEKIQDNGQLFYYVQLKIQFISYDTKEFLFSDFYNPFDKIKEIFAQRNFNRLKIYYQNNEINQDRTLEEIGVIENSALEIEEISKKIKLHINNEIRNIVVNNDMDIQTLKQQENLMNNNYQLFKINDQQHPLQDNSLLVDLINGNNEIELIYKMNQNVMQIVLFDQERKYIEYIQQNTQIKTFIQEFQNKYGLNNVSIFLEGEFLNDELKFSQISFNAEDEFEIVN
ncbi:unnamed protein product [Paramecium sonneborni]|uniref:Ubiquitin-like domain-containing protein n=1 Tax=Paramecium sonneborni TaxID=65129 RepID=A0A8S1R8A5_9CILI|nr:unnamed protein product [Paramecium sonneborni]